MIQNTIDFHFCLIRHVFNEPGQRPWPALWITRNPFGERSQIVTCIWIICHDCIVVLSLILSLFFLCFLPVPHRLPGVLVGWTAPNLERPFPGRFSLYMAGVPLSLVKGGESPGGVTGQPNIIAGLAVPVFPYPHVHIGVR